MSPAYNFPPLSCLSGAWCSDEETDCYMDLPCRLGSTSQHSPAWDSRTSLLSWCLSGVRMCGYHEQVLLWEALYTLPLQELFLLPSPEMSASASLSCPAADPAMAIASPSACTSLTRPPKERTEGAQELVSLFLQVPWPVSLPYPVAKNERAHPHSPWCGPCSAV